MTDPIPRLNAALEGRYRIERQLGEGGMATVYLADDLRHERKVALKVLKPELAAVVGADRFLAEIKTTANLQHPHILPLFDSGEADSFLFYVMPYVEGESLRERLDREHQLPVDEAVQIAKNVAEALDYAHSQGVIHRDIKPANILLQAGKPVVSDFGIALAVGAAGGGRLTETGLSLGTPHYMSPEQATGDLSVGPATDIYALGCVLYEMLVGDPPYVASTPQAILGKIIAGELTSATKQRATIPPNVDAVLLKSLERVPADRFASAKNFATALGDPGFRHGLQLRVVATEGGGRVSGLTVGLGVAAVVFAGVAAWALLQPAPQQSLGRFPSPFLPGQAPALAAGPTPFDLSEDGSTLVYLGEDGRVWLRTWGFLEGSPVPGSERSGSVAISPDGSEIALSRDGEVQVWSQSAGSMRTLIPDAGNPLWAADGYVYASVGDQGTVRVRAEGGSVEQVTVLGDRESRHIVRDVLPGGRTALIEVLSSSGTEVQAADLETGETSRLVAGRSGVYSPTGHLVFISPQNDLMAVRFDPGRAEMLGAPVPVSERVLQFSVSPAGTLVYVTSSGGREAEFVWVSRTGIVEPLGWAFNPGGGRTWSLAPDDGRLAYTADGTEPGSQNLWIKELPDGPETLVANDEGEAWGPRWRADGETLTYTLGQTGGRAVLSRRADGTGTPDILFDGPLDVPAAQLSPDEGWLILRVGLLGGGRQTIMAMRAGADTVPSPLFDQAFDATEPALSPDGRWIAFTSTESGQSEVYVRPFPDVGGGRWQISTDGGVQPMWAHSGRELFYVSADREMWAVEVESGTRFRTLGREVLFDVPAEITNILGTRWTAYEVSSDDQRFLMRRPFTTTGSETAFTGHVVTQNWFAELCERTGDC